MFGTAKAASQSQGNLFTNHPSIKNQKFYAVTFLSALVNDFILL